LRPFGLGDCRPGERVNREALVQHQDRELAAAGERAVSLIAIHQELGLLEFGGSVSPR
jgi:hypothetical protein